MSEADKWDTDREPVIWDREKGSFCPICTAPMVPAVPGHLVLLYCARCRRTFSILLMSLKHNA